MNIKCQICNHWFENYVGLSNHIKKHNISTKDYYDKYLKIDGSGICYCGKSTKYINMILGYSKYCSYKCSSNSKETRLLYKNTCIKKYNFGNVSQVDKYKQKRKLTWIKNFGVDHPMKSQNVRLRNKLSWLNQTSEKKISIKNKKQITCIDRYGGIAPLSSKIILNKSISTIYKKYGVRYTFESKVIQKKSQDTCLKNYGVINYAKTDEFKQLARENLIKDIDAGLKDGETFSPRIGHEETSIINEFEGCTGFLFPLRNKQLYGYFPDARNDDLKIIIEVYEPWHNLNWSKKHDFDKKKFLESRGYIYFIIWLHDWKVDKNQIINNFKNLMNREQMLN